MSDQVKPPGWYPVPGNPSQNRYWDGDDWAEPSKSGVNGLAIASLIFGLIAVLEMAVSLSDEGQGAVIYLMFGTAAVISGFSGLIDMKKTHERGKARAITGIVLGAVQLVVVIVYVGWQMGT